MAWEKKKPNDIKWSGETRNMSAKCDENGKKWILTKEKIFSGMF